MRARLSLASARPCSIWESVFEPRPQLTSTSLRGRFNCLARALMRLAISGELYKDRSCILYKPPKSPEMAKQVLTIADNGDNMQP
nr:MAG TPA: hypothetical protein [Caudoviricetes sp.]